MRGVRTIKLIINGLDLQVEVDGAKGKECMSLTEFLTSAEGVTVEKRYTTVEYAEREVPVGVRI